MIGLLAVIVFVALCVYVTPLCSAWLNSLALGSFTLVLAKLLCVAVIVSACIGLIIISISALRP